MDTFLFMDTFLGQLTKNNLSSWVGIEKTHQHNSSPTFALIQKKTKQHFRFFSITTLLCCQHKTKYPIYLKWLEFRLLLEEEKMLS